MPSFFCPITKEDCNKKCVNYEKRTDSRRRYERVEREFVNPKTGTKFNKPDNVKKYLYYEVEFCKYFKVELSRKQVKEPKEVKAKQKEEPARPPTPPTVNGIKVT